MILLVGYCFGYIIGSMNRSWTTNQKHGEREPLDEHAANAPRPHYWK
jgi:hypothetical protein